MPKLPRVKGLKVCRQTDGRWTREFKRSENAAGEPVFWLTGSFERSSDEPDDDLLALDNGYASLVPCKIDVTDYDFKARMILFPKDVFLKAMLPIDTPYLNYADEHPCYLHTSDERSRLTWHQACVWMDSAGMLFSGDYTSQYRELLEFDWLQSFLIWLFGTIPEKQESQSSSTRQQQICRSFMQLVREYAAQEHGAAFYAGKLCISTRYLHRATTLCLNGKSPKQIIEEQLLAEVKVLLDNPSLTVTAISERLNFPDQSYLTRFFKRHTGISPRRFRMSFGG